MLANALRALPFLALSASAPPDRAPISQLACERAGGHPSPPVVEKTRDEVLGKRERKKAVRGGLPDGQKASDYEWQDETTRM